MSYWRADPHCSLKPSSLISIHERWLHYFNPSVKRPLSIKGIIFMFQPRPSPGASVACDTSSANCDSALPSGSPTALRTLKSQRVAKPPRSFQDTAAWPKPRKKAWASCFSVCTYIVPLLIHIYNIYIYVDIHMYTSFYVYK